MPIVLPPNKLKTLSGKLVSLSVVHHHYAWSIDAAWPDAWPLLNTSICISVLLVYYYYLVCLAQKGAWAVCLFSFILQKKEINVLHELANQNEASWELVAVGVANTWDGENIGQSVTRKKKVGGWWDSGALLALHTVLYYLVHTFLLKIKKQNIAIICFSIFYHPSCTTVGLYFY